MHFALKTHLDFHATHFILKQYTLPKMNTDLAQQAISSALLGQWKEAISINLKILQDYPDDLDAMNRIARAYVAIGEYTKAHDLAHKVLTHDSLNTLARKCIERCEMLKEVSMSMDDADRDDGDDVPQKTVSFSFLEVPGRTKIVNLLNIGDLKVISRLDPGDNVALVPRSHKVSVSTINGKYIGRLPDDLANKLISLIENGNEYESSIKSVSVKSISVFIKGYFFFR